MDTMITPSGVCMVYTLEVPDYNTLTFSLVGIFSTREKAKKYRTEYIDHFEPDYLTISMSEIEKDFPIKERTVDWAFPYE